MKYKLLFALLFPVCFNCLGKSLTDTTKEFEFTRVILANSLTKEKIYNRTLEWCADAFKDSKSAIQLKDKDGGIVTGHAYSLTSYPLVNTFGEKIEIPIPLWFNWKIEIKEGKCRFSVYNVEYENEGKYNLSSEIVPYQVLFQSKSKTQKNWVLIKEKASLKINEFIDSYSTFINKKADNW